MQRKQYDGVHCDLRIEPFLQDVILITISGTDIGEFGDAPMRDLSTMLDGNGPIKLFIDARDVRGASIEVSGEWAAWLRSHRVQIREVSMLTGSRFIQITADFVRRFADLEGIMRVYTDPAAFDTAFALSINQH